MDALDEKLLEHFEGKAVRKDLLHRIKKGTNVPTFVLEDLGSAPMIRKTTWYQEQWDNTSSEGDSALPSVADMLVPHSHVAHYTVDNCNSPEACALMKQHTCELFLLANTRVVKECVLEIPTVTYFSK